MGIFYTGKGDKGKSIVGSMKIDKTSVEIEALGDLDELNSLLGIIKHRVFISFKEIIENVQENLFIIQANVAGFMQPKFKPPVFESKKIKNLEKLIDDFERKVKPALKFVIPGGTEESAWFDYARAVSRRAERSVLRYSKKHALNLALLSYMNRLSSLFFAMARMSVSLSDRKERHPTYK